MENVLKLPGSISTIKEVALNHNINRAKAAAKQRAKAASNQAKVHQQTSEPIPDIRCLREVSKSRDE